MSLMLAGFSDKLPVLLEAAILFLQKSWGIFFGVGYIYIYIHIYGGIYIYRVGIPKIEDPQVTMGFHELHDLGTVNRPRRWQRKKRVSQRSNIKQLCRQGLGGFHKWGYYTKKWMVYNGQSY